jgi:hypothetical protein
MLFFNFYLFIIIIIIIIVSLWLDSLVSWVTLLLRGSAKDMQCEEAPGQMNLGNILVHSREVWSVTATWTS